MLTFAAECIGAELVKFCPAVTAKMKTQTIAAALALSGDPVETALRAALISAIFFKHGGEAPVRRRKLA